MDALGITMDHPAPGLGQEETRKDAGALQRARRRDSSQYLGWDGLVVTLARVWGGGLGWPAARRW